LTQEPLPSMWCEVAGWGSQEPSEKAQNDPVEENDWLSEFFNVPAFPDISIGMSGGFSVRFNENGKN